MKQKIYIPKQFPNQKAVYVDRAGLKRSDENIISMIWGYFYPSHPAYIYICIYMYIYIYIYYNWSLTIFAILIKNIEIWMKY